MFFLNNPIKDKSTLTDCNTNMDQTRFGARKQALFFRIIQPMEVIFITTWGRHWVNISLKLAIGLRYLYHELRSFGKEQMS